MLLGKMDIRYWSFAQRTMYKGEDAIDLMQNCTMKSLLDNGEFHAATGILSTDGTMVYEGDIVKADIPIELLDGKYHSFEFVVEYQKNGARFSINNGCGDIQIIGDKYNGPFE